MAVPQTCDRRKWGYAMKYANYFDLRILMRLGVCEYDPRKMEWHFDNVKWRALGCARIAVDHAEPRRAVRAKI